MGYKSPVLRTAQEAWEPYALEVLAGILDGGNSARFSSHLVRETQIAAAVGAGYGLTDRIASVFLINGTPAQGRTIEELEQAIRAQIKRLRDEPVSEEELARVKAQVVAGNVYERDSIFYQAMQIGALETNGLGWRLMDEYVDRIKAITAEQIQQVARQYLVEDQLTVATLDPLPLSSAHAMPRIPMGGNHVR